MSSRVYTTFNYPDSKEGDKTFLTGVRKCHNKYYISGYYLSGDISSSFVYSGKITGEGTWNVLSYPSTPTSTVTTTTLYGPNPIRENYINVVGNYKTLETGDRVLGALYQGKLNGSGIWKTLIPSKITSETIAHSTIGNLVVGNYLEEGHLFGKAFIYDICTEKYYNISSSYITSITAYGVWKNHKHCYTICGGTVTNKRDNVAYLVDWNNNNNTLSNWRFYKYDNDSKMLLTHFNGIGEEECANTYKIGRAHV